MMSHISEIKHKLRIDSKHQIVCDGDYYPTYTVDIQGTPINYSKVGTGKPLVFVHGWSGAWYGWVRTSKYLKDYEIYMLDLPGFGRSGALEEYSIETAAEYLAAFIKKMKMTPEAVVGLSMSAFIVALLAQRNPKLLKRAVLVGPVFKTQRLNKASHSITHRVFLSIKDKEKLKRWVKTGFDTRIVAQILARSLGMYHYKRELVDEYSILSRSRMSRKAFVEMYISATEANLDELLHNIDIPVHLIFGSHDKLTSREQAERILENISGDFTFYSVPHAGHVVSTEQPKRVADLVRTITGGE